MCAGANSYRAKVKAELISDILSEALTMANSLVLAYIGSNLTCVVLMVSYNANLQQVINKEKIIADPPIDEKEVELKKNVRENHKTIANNLVDIFVESKRASKEKKKKNKEKTRWNSKIKI